MVKSSFRPYLFTSPRCRLRFEKLIFCMSNNSLLSLWIRKFQNRAHKIPPIDPTLSQPNPVRPIDPYLPKVKVKVKSSLYFNWAPRHEGVLESGGTAPRILDPDTRWRRVVSFTSTGRFTSREIAPGIHWIGGLVGPRTGLDTMEKRKIPSPCRDSNPRSSSPQPSAIPLSYPGSLRSILMSSSHQCLGLPSGLLPSGLPTKTL
jgi:hypothetical protein